MDDNFVIQDIRTIDSFKDKTFSGFKKKEVIKALLKSVEQGEIESACNWLTECIISGYSIEILDKLVVFASKIIHINNPSLPNFICKKYLIFYNSIDTIDLKKQKHLLIHIRNNQVIRNLLFDITTTITSSPKSKRYDKYPKMNDSIDFTFENIKKRLKAQANYCPDSLFKFTDPEDIRIVINELMLHFKNSNTGYEYSSYWLSWIIQWEKINKKNKIKWEIDERDIKGIKKDYCKDVLWLVWSAILYETQCRDDKTKLQISSLYQLYKHSFTMPKRNMKIPLLYHAIGYLTHCIEFIIPIRTNKQIFIQTQCNLNIMFKMKKRNEISDKPKSKRTQTIDIKQEQINDKISIINDIDMLIK